MGGGLDGRGGEGMAWLLARRFLSPSSPLSTSVFYLLHGSVRAFHWR